ncbi:MAG: hypothetical protein IKD42_05820 [Kiritimatiellae bacterium]|nr:hypothetical protein [Kiritimatiellia bacterium]
METENRQGDNRKTGVSRPRLAIYHANPKGNGCAVKLELHPAHDFTDGSVMAAFARQIATADRNSPGQFARFDWENQICVKLDFSDISKILQVLVGECESIDDGKGLFHRSQKAATKITFRHLEEPVQGYSFEVYRTYPGGGAGEAAGDASARIVFTKSEALGLAKALEGTMPYVCFGIPMVIPKTGAA